jgi:hypothetical protein
VLAGDAVWNEIELPDPCLGVHEAAGLTGAAADDANRTVFTFVIGMALGVAAEAAWRTRLRREGGNQHEQARDAIARAMQVAMQFPRSRAHAQAWQAADPAAAGEHSFEFGLEAVLNGLQARLPAPPMPASPGAHTQAYQPSGAAAQHPSARRWPPSSPMRPVRIAGAC